MAENENVLEEELKPELAPEEPVEEVQPEVAPEEQGPTKGQKAKAAVKEWFRKKAVSLKRKTHIIALVVLLVSSLIYICSLSNFSQSVYQYKKVDMLGFPVFVNMLFCILVLLLYLWSFPKRKKPNYIMIALTFIFMGVMIALDIVFHINLAKAADNLSSAERAALPFIDKSLTLAIVHVVFVGISAVLLATLPLYKKLIMKINTRKVVESTEIKEEIDTSEEV